VARAATEAGARTSNAAAWLAGRLAAAPPPSRATVVGGGDPTFLIFFNFGYWSNIFYNTEMLIQHFYKMLKSIGLSF
jgi:hypothetical protein